MGNFISNDASLVKYTFFLTNNENDKISFYIAFGSGSSIRPSDMVKILNAYPNPASDNVTIAYQLPQGNMAPAYLVVKNLIGKTVMTVPMPQASEKMMINVSDLTTGVYFYSIEQNSRALMTKKMIVK